MKGRVAALDGLRAVGIAMVFTFHAVPSAFVGRLGVDVFFPLSGFLITGLLLEEFDSTGTVRLARFYRRRVSRLYPALIVTVAGVIALAAVGIGFPSVGAALASVGLALGYATNLAIAFADHSGADPLSPTWSLALEEQFYLLWPAVLAVALARGARRPTIALGAIGAAIFGWVVLSASSTFSGYFRPDARLGGLMVGCAAALLVPAAASDEAVDSLARHGFVAIVLAVVFGSLRANEHFSNATAIPLMSLGVAAVLPWLTRRPWSLSCRILASPAAIWLGRRSYGLYLLHVPVIALCRSTGASWLAVLAVAAPLSLTASDVLYRLVEVPASRLRDHSRPAVIIR